MKVPQYNPDAYDEDTRESIQSQGKYGVMYSEDYDWSPEECTRRAYRSGDSYKKRSVAFHTPLLDHEEALECIHQIPQYNSFDPDKVALQLSKMPEDTKIAVGREGSPVLYIYIDKENEGFLRGLLEDLKDMGEPDPEAGIPRAWVSGPNEYGKVSRENREFSKYHYPDGANQEKVLIRAWWD